MLLYVLLAVLAFLMLVVWRKKPKMQIEIETSDNTTIKGRNLMATINTNQKIKLTAIPNGSVDASTFSVYVAGLPNITVTTELVAGELAVYAVATDVLGDSDVALTVASTDGTVLKDHVLITVVAAPADPATAITILVGEPEAK